MQIGRIIAVAAFALGLAYLAMDGAAFGESTPTDASALPRTQDGKPDFQGVWASRWLSPMERPAEASGLVVDDAEAARLVDMILTRAANPNQLDPELAYPDASELVRVRGEHRSSLLIAPENGKMPYTPAGLAALRGYIGGADGPEQRMTTERCIGGVGWAPLQIRTHAMLRRLVQTGDHLIVHTEAYSDVRLIEIGGDARPAAMKPPAGDSTARWDGDALVVETRNFAPHLSTHGIVTVMSPDAVVTERFELASPDEIVYRYTVVDPAYYSSPWTVEYALTRTDEPLYEFACHEGNYSLEHMLAGARVEEKRAAQAGSAR
ncbi:hypothetical protein GC169_08740 [bacterium]|nr:hypothetical protein [bacterium]